MKVVNVMTTIGMSHFDIQAAEYKKANPAKLRHQQTTMEDKMLGTLRRVIFSYFVFNETRCESAHFIWERELWNVGQRI